jgi:hypothetical protein
MPATAVSRLADADRLDDDDVVAGGLAQQHRLARVPATPPRLPGRRRGADEGLLALRQQLHARLVAEDGAAGDAWTRDRPPAPRRGGRARSGTAEASMKVDLPTPGTPEMPMRIDWPVCGSSAAEHLFRPAA